MLELGRIAAAAGPADLQVHVPGESCVVDDVVLMDNILG
jgi:hypothetical protein